MPSQLTDVQIFARVLAAIPGSEIVAAIDGSGLAFQVGPIQIGEMIDRHCSEAGEGEDVEPSELNIAIDYLHMGETESAIEILRKLAANPPNQKTQHLSMKEKAACRHCAEVAKITGSHVSLECAEVVFKMLERLH